MLYILYTHTLYTIVRSVAVLSLSTPVDSFQYFIVFILFVCVQFILMPLANARL